MTCVIAFAMLAVFAPAVPAWSQSPPVITKMFAAASIPLNTSTTLTFTITNPNPPKDLTGVGFSDTLPAGLIFANPDSLVLDPVLGPCDSTATTGGISMDVTTITLSGGVIPAKATCTFSVDVLAVAGGDQVNTTGAVTSVEGGTGNTATATLTVLAPDLTIAKTHVGNFTQGQSGATYTLTVSNVGGADTVALVTVTDTLPPGLTATAISGTDWICSVPPALTCTRGDVLAAGTSYPVITVSVNVAASAPALVTNTATVSGGGEINATNNTATDPTTIIQVSDLTITKAHVGSFSQGQDGAVYTLTVSNVGTGSTSGMVTVTDSLPPGLTAAAMSGPGWLCSSPPASTCTRTDPLAAGSSYPAITLTVSVAVDAPALVTNTATVSGGGEANTGNNTTTDPTVIARRWVVIGPGPGSSPLVRVFDAATEAPLVSGFVYPSTFTGGVYVAVGDVNGDGVPDIITGPGSGSPPLVRVFDGGTGAELASGFPYEPTFTGGVRVAFGDVTGDGSPNIVTAPGPGHAPLVRVFDGRTGAEVMSFMAYDPAFTGGVFVAVGDVNGDGHADIVTGADAGGVPEVRVFSGRDGSLLGSFLPYPVTFTGGVRVAVGDLNGDGFADIITAPGPGGAPAVKVFSGRDGTLLGSLFAYDPTFTGGVYVAAGSIGGDVRADIITGPDAGSPPLVQVFDGRTGILLGGGLVYDPAFTGGVRVGASGR